MLLNINKIVNPEKSRDTVFSKSDSAEDSGSTPMDIDSAEKSKGKSKNKQVASATAEKNNNKKFCHICKKTSHNTTDCYHLAKNADKKPKPKSSTGGDSKQGGNGIPATKVFKAKKTRVIQVEITDNEDDTPPPWATIATARIEEIEEPKELIAFVEDEPQKHASVKDSDFLKHYM